MLQQCAFALNSTTHQATRHSPFYAVYLRHPSLPLDHALAGVRDHPVNSVEHLVRTRSATDTTIHRMLTSANEYHVKYHNRKRRHLEFQPGDQVLLST